VQTAHFDQAFVATQRTAERKPYVGAAVVGVAVGARVGAAVVGVAVGARVGAAVVGRAVGARVGAKLAVVQHTLDLFPLQKPYLKLVLQKLESLALGSMQTPGCPSSHG
jgi:uncharacterized membrane protein